MLDPNRKLFRWGPIDGCPFFMYYTIPSSFKKMRDIFGYCYPESIIIFENKKVLWILDNDDFLKNGIEFTKKHIMNKDNKKLFLEKWNCVADNLLKIFYRLEKIDLSKTDNEVLYKIFDEFSDTCFKFWEVGMTLELIILAVETWLSEKLKGMIKEEREYNELFAKLSTPIDLTFYRQEEKDLIEIFKMNEERQGEELKRHQQEYFWIYNSYLEAKVLNVAYFKHNLDKLKKENVEQLLSSINNYSKEIEEEKKKIIERLELDETSKTWIRSIEEFGLLQDIRKKYNFIADHYLELFAEEIGKRKGVSKDDLKILLPEELKSLLKDKLDKNVIRERKPLFVISAVTDKMEFLTGKKAEQMKLLYSVIKNIDQSRAIQGVVASRGKSYYFRGVAKIALSPDEAVEKIKEGEILVTPMTSPDYIIAMRKAGAIITDEGGILCHAAIVSRELRITCIVGTEVATKMIRDGDVIEIHGGKGTVKIIEHKNS